MKILCPSVPLVTALPDTAMSYSRDGLLFQYDGLENAGPGVYDESSTTFADLSGHGRDAALTQYGSFSDGALVCDGTHGIALASDAVGLSYVVTIELVYKGRANNQFSYVFCADASSGSAAGYSPRNVAFKMTSNYGQVCAFAGSTSLSYNAVPNTPASAYVSYDYSTTTGYLNSVAYTKSGTPSLVTETEGWSSCTIGDIGGRTARTGNTLQGGLCALRGYLRSLTAEEHLRHYLLDKKRFNLP